MLRDYQQECISSIVMADMEGCRRQLVALPTGTGKTKIASHLPEAIGLSAWQVMAFVVASEELAFQALADLRECNPNLRVTLEKAEYRGDVDADIVVASVDTLARSEDRLAAFARLPLRVIFLDECHGAVSPKYMKVLRALRVLKGEDNCDESRLLVGLTATPRRHDGLAMERIFDKIVYRKSIREMVAAGWIAEPIAYRVNVDDLNLDGAPRHAMDFALGWLSKHVNTPQINALVVRKYLEHGAGLSFIEFTVDIEHSETAAQTFRHHNISCEAISSDTPKARRKELVEAHRKGDILGLASCQALLQGFDSPRATVALFNRPTLSGLLYTQAVGRVLRKFPAPEAAPHHAGYVKQKAIIIDFCGASDRHRLYTASTLFGLSPVWDFRGESIPEALAKVEALQEDNPTLDIEAYAGLDDMRAAATRVDLWKPAPIPKLAKTCSQFIWSSAGPDLYRLSAPGMAVFIEQDLLGDFKVWRHAHGTAPDKHLQFNQPEDAFAFADSLVPDEAVKLVRAKAQWRKQEPSENQCRWLCSNDPIINKQFNGNGMAFYSFAVNRVQQSNMSFSKGALSTRIDALKFAKQKAVTSSR